MKIGRNDPCSCLSGKKYKRCCGSEAGPARLAGGVRITSEQQFLELITRIDDELRAKGTRPPARPLLAIGEFCKLVREELRVTVAPRQPRPGLFSGDDLVLRIVHWYDAHYGRKLDIDATAGEVVVLVRGDPWTFRLPYILGGGEVGFFCEAGRAGTLPTSPTVYRAGELLPRIVPTYNVLDALIEFPPALASSLTALERQDLLTAFLIGRRAHEILRRVKATELVKALRADLSAAAERLSVSAPHPGLAKWSSLQAAEKTLKAAIENAGGAFQRTHNLCDLAEQAEGLGLPMVDRSLLGAIQCSPGVRYGTSPVSLHEAVAAHHASLRVVAAVAISLVRK